MARQRGRIVGLDRQGLGVEPGRAFGLGKVQPVQLSEPGQQLGRPESAGGCRVVEDLGEFLEPHRGGHERVEGADGFGLVTELLANLQPGVDRVADLLELVLLHPREADQVGTALLVDRRGTGALAQGLAQGLPALTFLEQCNGGVERLPIGLVGVATRVVGCKRAVGLVEFVGETADLAQHRTAHHGRRLERGESFEHVDAGRGVAGGREQLVELVRSTERHGGVGVVEAHDLSEQCDCPRGVVAARLRGGGRFHVQSGGLRGLGLFGGVDQCVDMCRMKVGAQGELPKLAACVGVVGLVTQQGGVVAQGVGIATEDRQGGARFATQGDALGPGGERQRGQQRVDQRLGPVGHFVVRAQQAERFEPGGLGKGVGTQQLLQLRAGLGVPGGFVDQRAKLFERGRSRFEVVDRDLGDAQSGLAGFGRGEFGQTILPQLDQVFPSVAALEQTLDIAGELEVARVELELKLQVVDRTSGAFGEVLGRVGGVVEQPGPRLGVAGVLQGVVVLVEQVVPTLGVGQHHQQFFEGPGGRGVLVEDRAKHAQHLVGAVAEPLVVKACRAFGKGVPGVVGNVCAEHLAIGRAHFIGAVEAVGQLFEMVPGLQTLRRGLDRFESGSKGLPHRSVRRCWRFVVPSTSSHVRASSPLEWRGDANYNSGPAVLGRSRWCHIVCSFIHVPM